MELPFKENELRLGFLTALELSDNGTVAGLLVTNRFSRPLEFQCTAPVKPNRTQELLYGPTLRPFLLGELLSRPLLEKAGVKPHLVVTDQPEMLELRRFVNVPVVLVEGPVSQNGEQEKNRQNSGKQQPPLNSVLAASDRTAATAAHSGQGAGSVQTQTAQVEAVGGVTGDLTETDNGLGEGLTCNGVRLRLAEPEEAERTGAEDRKLVESMLAAVPKTLDLSEPLERVKDALKEATKALSGAGR